MGCFNCPVWGELLYNARMSQEPLEEPSLSQSRVQVVWLLLGLTAVFLWRIVFTFHVNLIPDECSYWTWSRRLDWSYFDNSGMVAYLIRLSTGLFGDNTPFSVRFPFLVISGITTFLVYGVSHLLFKNRRNALIAALMFNLTPVALLGGSAAIHDNALILFWMTTLWAAAHFLKSRNSKWLLVAGLAAGFSIQSKYTGVLVLLALLLFLLWNRELRILLLTREPWLGVAVAVVFTIPVLWWNVVHDWASLHHILFIGSGSVSFTRRILDGIGYHAAQFALVSPLLYVALLAACCTSLVRNVKSPNPEETLLLSFSFPLLLFGVQAFRGHVEANWSFMGYMSAIILMVEVIAGAGNDPRRETWKVFLGRYVKWGIALAVVPAALAVIHAWIGLLPASVERKLGKYDRVIWETRGWNELGIHVNKLRQPGDIIAGDSYQLCAILEFNVPGNPSVRYLAPWKRPTQFDVWEPSFDNLAGETLLYVSSRPLKPSSAAGASIYEHFERVEGLEPFSVRYHGEPIREIYVYRGYRFDPFSPRRLGPRSLFYSDYE